MRDSAGAAQNAAHMSALNFGGVGFQSCPGTTSIVFGLLAFNTLIGSSEQMALLAMVVVVLGSVVIHGIGAPVAAHAYARSHPGQTRLAP